MCDRLPLYTGIKFCCSCAVGNATTASIIFFPFFNTFCQRTCQHSASIFYSYPSPTSASSARFIQVKRKRSQWPISYISSDRTGSRRRSTRQWYKVQKTCLWKSVRQYCRKVERRMLFPSRCTELSFKHTPMCSS